MNQDSVLISPEQSVIPIPAEPASQENPEARYVRQINAMMRDAIESRAMEELADTLAWGLAIISNHAGAEATGDIIYRLGRHIRYMAERDRAKAEAEQAKQDGRVQ